MGIIEFTLLWIFGFTVGYLIGWFGKRGSKKEVEPDMKSVSEYVDEKFCD